MDTIETEKLMEQARLHRAFVEVIYKLTPVGRIFRRLGI